MKNKDIIKDLDRVAEGRENTVIENHGRRVWLQNFALASATSAVLWACGKKNDDNATASGGDVATDIKYLNIALDLELEAIFLYTAAAGLPVWTKDLTSSDLAATFLAIAKSFLGHHTAHKGLLEAKIKELGGTANAAKDDATYLKPYPTLTAQKGADGLLTVLLVAAEREFNAASAYASVASKFSTQTAGDLMASICPDESAHAGVLNAGAFVLNGTGSAITAANIVPGTVAPFTYHKNLRA